MQENLRTGLRDWFTFYSRCGFVWNFQIFSTFLNCVYVVTCFVNRIDFLGIYVIMFVTVLSSLVKVRGVHIYKLINLS